MNMENNRPKSVCLFFTYEMSLKKWDDSGILEREVFLYRDLALRGVEVAFFTYGGKEDLSYAKQLSGIKIIPAYAGAKKHKNRKLAFLYSLWLPVRFRKAMAGYDILKTNQMWGAWVPLVAKLLTGRRLLVRCGYEHYYTLIAEKWPYLERFIFYLFSLTVYSFSDHIIVTTKKIAEFVRKNFFVPRNKISVLPNFIDTDLFNSIEHPASIRDRLLYVGRLSKQKNLFALIESCKAANVGLDLVGQGDLEDKLKEMVDQRGADVHFLGVCPNSQLPEIFAKYKIFVLTSFYEGNPKSLLEAMSCGKAIIGTDVDGIRDIIKDGETGILCGISVEQIASAISKIKEDFGLQQKLGERARQYVLVNHSVNKIVDREFDIYCRMLNGGV